MDTTVFYILQITNLWRRAQVTYPGLHNKLEARGWTLGNMTQSLWYYHKDQTFQSV